MRDTQTMLTHAPETATRTQTAFTAEGERRVLRWLAVRAPRWLSSDQLTALGLGAQIGAGLSYAAARTHPWALWMACVCIVLNWLGDSLDGTLARVRHQQRPRYGFYVDHMVDVLGAVAMMGGLACSGLLHPMVALAMLIAFLVLSAESYLATHTLHRFELSHGAFGPTEIRLLLIAGTLRVLHSPYVTVAGHRWLLFELGGVIATASMAGMALWVTASHTRELYLQEPLP